jgi:hypothetical protein
MRPHIRLLSVLASAPLVACGGGGGGSGGGPGTPVVTPVPTGLFVPASAPDAWSGIDYRGLVARHQDGDGVLDLVGLDRFGQAILAHPGLGDGHFAAPASLGAFANPGYFELHDLDGDGLDEALVLDWNNEALLVGDGLPDGTFGLPVAYPLGSESESLAVGDVNEDGLLDVVVGEGSGAELWLGAPKNAFVPGPAFTNTSEYYVALADVNEDGHLDLLSSPGGPLRRRLGNGDGTFAAPVDFVGPEFFIYGPMSLGDVNGDGHVDVVAGYGMSDRVGVSLGDGLGGFTAAPLIVVGAQIQFDIYLTLAHLDADAHLDLLVARDVSGELHVFHGVGDGTFTFRQALPISPSARALLVADWNGDGAQDLLVATMTNGGTVHAFLGTKQ